MATVSHEAYLTEESEIADVSRLGMIMTNRDTSAISDSSYERINLQAELSFLALAYKEPAMLVPVKSLREGPTPLHGVILAGPAPGEKD
ncbi:hypothetical protein DPMN_001095 [Dreissena polymorpha]|uniref:Uncharacterized protein n=1 Tax=Dreissena polymorpha TaxID=45954 RepID=A0A9D4MHX3_DREPO|nr:hypothetical protein DPMN_001095 [Dreissena polymorpha]